MAFAWAPPSWRDEIGLELYTIRDLLSRDFEGAIAGVAEIGYKEIEPVRYLGLDLTKPGIRRPFAGRISRAAGPLRAARTEHARERHRRPIASETTGSP
jgi:hypothetical protein